MLEDKKKWSSWLKGTQEQNGSKQNIFQLQNWHPSASQKQIKDVALGNGVHLHGTHDEAAAQGQARQNLGVLAQGLTV